MLDFFDFKQIANSFVGSFLVLILTTKSKGSLPNRKTIPYLFAAIIIIPLCAVNFFLIHKEFNLKLSAYVYPVQFTILLSLVFALAWIRPNISRRGKKILKLFKKTNEEALTRIEIINALNLQIHQFESAMSDLINDSYMVTDGGPRYWPTSNGYKFLNGFFLF